VRKVADAAEGAGALGGASRSCGIPIIRVGLANGSRSRPPHLPSAFEAIASGVRSPAEIDIAIDALARAPAGGLLVLPDTFNTVHRDRIVAAAVHHRLPAIYPSRFFAAGGGLMSYGSDLVELMRLAATSVDRILRGATPHDLPVQSSTSSSW
jgi:ABC-type uncharacterized transport system substrate-binding protein